MALLIRLTRKGTKKVAFFRIGVFDSRRARDSAFIEDLGYYDLKTKPAKLEVKKERLKYWLGTGAKLSEALESILKKTVKGL